MITALIATAVMGQEAVLTGTAGDGKRHLEDVVVWLEGKVESKPLKAKIDQKDMKFVPRILAVPKGSTVSFPNSDTVYHNVFAQFEAKTFDLGMYPRGQSKSVTFDRPGIVSVLCNIHAEMSAYVVIVDSPYYTKTDKKGEYRIKCRPGDYTLRAWHESGQEYKGAITLRGGPAAREITVKRR